MKREILYIGYGDLGKRLSNISSDKLNITAIGRNKELINHADIQIQFDLHSNSSLKKELLSHYHAVIITLVPQSFDLKGYEKGYIEGMKRINQLLKSVSFNTALLISSTRVYGSRNNFINETTVALPDDFRGACLLKSEKLFTKSILSKQKLIARTSGLYNKSPTSNIAKWVNHFDGQKIILPNKTMNRICRDRVAKFMFNFCMLGSELKILNLTEPSISYQDAFSKIFPKKGFNEYFEVNDIEKIFDLTTLDHSNLLE